MNRPSYLLFKQCSKCKKILHIGKYCKKNGCKYGVNSYCRECKRKQAKKYREEHKEEISKYNKRYKEEHKEEINEYNKRYKEEYKDYQKKYREEHRDYYNEYNKRYIKENKGYQKKYREEHRDYYNEYQKKYNKENPQNTFNNSVKRRKKESVQGDGISREQWLEMMNFFDWRCAYSGEYIGGDNDKRTIDHIIPITKNGEHEVWNCVPMLKSYNSSKHTKDMLDWYLEQEYFDIDRLTKIYEWRIYAYWKWKE